jgi:hypothetical protein
MDFKSAFIDERFLSDESWRLTKQKRRQGAAFVTTRKRIT